MHIVVKAIAEGQSTAFEAARLDLWPASRVWRVERLQLQADMVLMHEAVVLPSDLFKNGVHGGYLDITTLANHYGLTLGRAEERAHFVAARAPQAKELGLDPGARIIFLERLVCAANGRPIEWRLAHCRTRTHIVGARRH